MLPLPDGRESKHVVSMKSGLIGKVFDISFFVLPLILGISYFVSNSTYRKLEDEPLKNSVFERVLIIADKDRCNGTSCDEWGDVYASLGLKDTGNMGRDIDYKDLQRYVLMSEQLSKK